MVEYDCFGTCGDTSMTVQESLDAFQRAWGPSVKPQVVAIAPARWVS